MDGYKVLITASGLGKRLGERTRYTNKALVPVGPMPAISHILRGFGPTSDFVVTTGYCGDQVEDYLRMAHPDKNFTFVPVAPYEGPGSSLAYSMWCAREHLQQPFIFSCCDTLANDVWIHSGKNWVAGCKTRDSSQYRTFSTVDGEHVSCFHEKGELTYDYAYVGLAGIEDWDAFWKALEAVMVCHPEDQGLSDVHVLQRMIVSGHRFCVASIGQWFDVGSPRGLADARRTYRADFEVLEKPDESIFMVGDRVIKFFRDQEVVSNRCKRAEQLRGMVPEIVDAHGCFYAYNKVPGAPLSKCLDLPLFNRLLVWLEKHLWECVPDEGHRAVFENFYFTKTTRRIMEFLSTSRVQDHPTHINGVRVPGAIDLVAMIEREELCKWCGRVFHGDLVLDNILCTGNGFALIDWRQDFGGQTGYGDRNYDLAKLNHSLVLSHSGLNQGQFTLVVDDDDVCCDVLRPNLWVECQKALGNYIVDEPVDILTPLIWLNMSPLHSGEMGRFLYYFGRYHLYRALEGRL